VIEKAGIDQVDHSLITVLLHIAPFPLVGIFLGKEINHIFLMAR
jgi:hypothetical protein